MNTGRSADDADRGDVLDWLREQGKQRDGRVPAFDVEEILRLVGAARDADTVNFWAALSPAEQEAFASTAREQLFTVGGMLMRQGDRAQNVMVIRRGRVKVCVDENGRERVIAERGPGDLIGEHGAMPGGIRSASVVAVEAVVALVVRTEDYAAFIGEHPGVPDLVKQHVYDRLTGPT